ncbi:MAG: M16 family metallopeptidase [Pyrinomonadaceae bacterium]
MRQAPSSIFSFCSLAILGICAVIAPAQEKPPAPGPPRPVQIPQVVEKRLPNGLTVVTVERKGSPLVATRLMIGAGASAEKLQSAGLANVTAELLTKGTKTRDATKVAEDLEFLGADLGTSVGLDQSNVSMSVTSDKIGPAMAVMSDVILHPTFPQSELDLLKSQKLDELTANLSTPGFLTSYVASVYAFGASPASGTPASLQTMTRNDVASFYHDFYTPSRATLFFVGDITPAAAYQIAQTNFGGWRVTGPVLGTGDVDVTATNERSANVRPAIVNRILVIDLPKSGQASVSFVRDLRSVGHVRAGDAEQGHREIGENYFPGVLANSVLGGGYSSRLNLEIRIKRGLSYGAGSSMSWRPMSSRFSTRVQTKNESAAEVAELTIEELTRLGKEPATPTELAARRASLIGDFGLHLETDAELLDVISELYANRLGADELRNYEHEVTNVDTAKITQFAAQNFVSGDMIIAGDYSVFKDDLKKRFPNTPITVIEADKLDLTKPTLQK